MLLSLTINTNKLTEESLELRKVVHESILDSLLGILVVHALHTFIKYLEAVLFIVIFKICQSLYDDYHLFFVQLFLHIWNFTHQLKLVLLDVLQNILSPFVITYFLDIELHL